MTQLDKEKSGLTGSDRDNCGLNKTNVQHLESEYSLFAKWVERGQ